jgi:tape measure domain-containing protein
MVAITDKVTIEARFEGQNLRQGTNQAVRDMKRFEDSIERVEKENKQLRGELNRVQRELKQTGTAAKKAGTEMEAMNKAGALLKRGLAGLAVYMSVGALKQYGEEWTNLRNRVKLFTKDQEETNRVVQELFVTSNKTRQSVSDTAEVYQRFAMANKALNLSQGELQKLLLTINQSVALSGVSGQAASAALVQLGQGMAAGVLRGEELNSVIEQTPRLAMAIAEGMGKTTGDLKRLGEQGKITAAAVVNSIFKEAKRVDAEFEKLTPTIDQSLVVLNNSFGQFIDKLEQQYGIFEKLANKIGDLGLAMGAGDGGEAMKGFMADAGDSLVEGTLFVGQSAIELGWEKLLAFNAHYTEKSMRNISNIVGEFDADLGRTMNRLTSEFIWGRASGPGGVDHVAGRPPAPSTTGAPTVPDSFNVKPNNYLKQSEMISRLQKRPQVDARFNEFMASGGDHVGGGLSSAMQDKLQEADAAFDELLQDQQEARNKASEEEVAREKAAQGTLAAMRISLIDEETLAFKAQQQIERQTFQERFGEDQKLMEAFDLLQEAQLNATEATEDAARAAEELADNLKLIGDVAGGLKSVMGEMGLGKYGGLVDQGAGIATALVTGDPIGMITNSLGLFSDVVGFLTPEVDEAAEAERRYQEALRQTRMELQQTVEGIVGSSGAFRDAQREATQGIRDSFENFAVGTGSTWERLRGFLSTTADETETLGEALARMQEQGSEAAINLGGPLAYMVEQSTTAMIDQYQDYIDLFGEDVTFHDVKVQALQMSDALTGMGRAAKMTAEELAPLTRSIRMGFDVEEMALRTSASKRMTLAGADVGLQNRVFRDLSRSIDRLRSRESATIRAARTGSSAKVSVGSTGGGSTGSSSTTTTTDSAGALVPEVRLNEIVLDEWADAVDVSNAVPIERNWNDIVPLIGSGTGHKRINPEYWYRVVETNKGLERNKINRNWNDVIPLLGQAHKRINPGQWDLVVEVNKGLETNKIERNWNDVVPLLGQAHKRINPEAWVNVIEVKDLNANPIDRNWHQVVRMGDKINVNSWNDVFAFGTTEQMGGWTRTAPIPQMSLGWGDIFNLGNMGTIDLDVGAAVRLVGERAKIDIGDLIDMGALDGIITNAVNRGLRDRSVTVSTSAANSTSGTNTSGGSRKPSALNEWGTKSGSSGGRGGGDYYR